MHFVSACCRGEFCGICTREGLHKVPAQHKIGEEMFHDDPHPYRHGLTQYVCCFHFRMLFGGDCGANWEQHEYQAPWSENKRHLCSLCGETKKEGNHAHKIADEIVEASLVGGEYLGRNNCGCICLACESGRHDCGYC